MAVPVSPSRDQRLAVWVPNEVAHRVLEEDQQLPGVKMHCPAPWRLLQGEEVRTINKPAMLPRSQCGLVRKEVHQQGLKDDNQHGRCATAQSTLSQKAYRLRLLTYQ